MTADTRSAPNQGTGRLYVVEYLRGLAALAVAWFHLTNTYSPALVRNSGTYGWLGVEVFFVISGFIIPYSIATQFGAYSISNFPRFVARRILRLEPPYLVSVVLTIALWHLSAMVPSFRGQAEPSDALQAAAHIAYLIPFTSYQWYQPVYWTLAYEFAFYILIGLTFPWICRPKALVVWCAATLANIALVMADLLDERTLLFIVGIAVYRSIAIRSETLLGPVVVALATIVIAMKQPAIAIIGAATAGALFWGRSVRLDGLSGRLLGGLGAMSYSLYLTHIPIGGRVVNLGRRFVDGSGFEFVLSLCALALSLAIAYAFLLLVERPAVAFARRYGTAIRPPPQEWSQTQSLS